MAIKQELRTFKQIVDQIMSLMKYQSSDSVSRTRVQADVQRAYTTEVMPFHEWPWLRNKINVQAEDYYATGTASVTQGSVNVTLSEVILNTKKGYTFALDQNSETYTIKVHAGGSSTLILDVPYTGQTNATIKYKIWTDAIPLPAEAMEIISATHPYVGRAMEGMGLQDLRRMSSRTPKAEGRPYYYTLSEKSDLSPYSPLVATLTSVSRASDGLEKTIIFAQSLGSSPSNMVLQVGDRIELSGSGSYQYNIQAIVSKVFTTNINNDTIQFTGLSSFTEATTADTGITVATLDSESYEKQKSLIVHPSVNNTKTTISVDYVKEIQPLVADTDEPSIPLADRIVLFWLALSYSYSRERNTEEAILYRQQGEARLAKMAGKLNESTDKPSLVTSQNYLSSKRSLSRRNNLRGDGAWGYNSFGGGSTTNPLGTPNRVATFGDDGTLESSGLIDTVELASLDGVQGNIEARLNALGLPTGSLGGKVLVSSSGMPPAIIESTVDATSLEALAGSSGLETVLLGPSVSSPEPITSWDATLFTAITVRYTITHDTEIESGVFQINLSGTDISTSWGGVTSNGDVGFDLTADLAAGSIRLLYTSFGLSTGGVIKFKTDKWLA